MADNSMLTARYSSAQVALGVFVAATTLVLMGVQPILVGMYSDLLHLDLSESGWLLATEQFGGAAGALLGYAIATHVRWRSSIIIACALAALVNVATAFVRELDALLIARFTSGFASTLAYTVAIYFLSHTAKPDRVFGALMVLQTSCFSIDALLLPQMQARFGYELTIASAALWFIASLIAAVWLPDGTRSSDAPTTTAAVAHVTRARPLLGAAALSGAFLLQLSIFAVWGFLDRIGRNNGLSDQQIGFAIGIGVLGGIPGGLLPAIVGERFGRIGMITFATALLVASNYALGHALHLNGFLLWIGILNVGWVLGLTYYMGLTVVNDPTGRFARMIAFSQILAAGVGPMCSALVTVGGRIAPIFFVASIAALAGWVAVAGVMLVRR